MRSLREGAPFLVVIGTLAILAVLQPNFFSGDNILNVSRQGSFMMLFAAAQMLPILVRGLDLSQGSLIALESVVFASLAGPIGVGSAFCVAIVLGLGVGLVNGLLAGYGRISPFVATLGTGSILLGAALILSNGQTVYAVPPEFSNLAWGTFARLPSPVVVAVLCLLCLSICLNRLTIGRYIYAVGSNPRASELSGIPYGRTLLVAYVGSSALTAIGAAFLASRVASGSPTLGLDQSLQSVAAVVIGGVSLFGGRGTVLGVFLGAAFLAILSNALNLLNVMSYWQDVVIGITVISAVLFDRLRQSSF